MPSLRNRTHQFKPSLENREGAAHLARALEGTPIAPEAEPMRAEILALLHDMGNGLGFAIFPLDKQLTPSQAAEVLGVSRTHLMRIVQKGELPYRMVGAHHRLRLEDVLQYRDERECRGQALDELIEQAQELALEH